MPLENQDKNKQIDDFIRAIEESFSGLNPKTFWPLNGGQIGAYFDADEALDVYYRINKLKQTLTIKQIADLMPAPDILRIFIQNNGIIGLKVAKKLGLVNINEQDITNYSLFLFEILEQQVKSDIFCLDGKNFLLEESEIEKIASKTYWDEPKDSEEKKQLAFLTVMANNLCYTLYYDIFMTWGFYLHGPYNVERFFGKNAIMLVRDYHNLNPIELWPDLTFPHKSIRIYAIYNKLDVKINFVNHPITRDSIGDKLIAYKVYVDDKKINAVQIPALIELINNTAISQSKKINSLSDLDKVRKGAEISFYSFKKLREFMGDNWKPPMQIENTIQKFGEQFINQFKYKTSPDIEHWKKAFDPRIDYF
jgi:hypothetical protein